MFLYHSGLNTAKRALLLSGRNRNGGRTSPDDLFHKEFYYYGFVGNDSFSVLIIASSGECIEK